MTLNGSRPFLKHSGDTGKQLTFLSGQKLNKQSTMEWLKGAEISSFDDYYDIATNLDELIETHDFTMDEWVELYEISEKVMAYENDLDKKGIEND